MNKGHFFNITLLIALVAALLPVGAMAAPPDPAISSRTVARMSMDKAGSQTPLESSPLPSREAGEIQIRLQQATFDPLKTSPQFAQALTKNTYEGDGSGYYLVQFNGPILPEWKTALVDTGAVLHDYVPDFAFITKMDAVTLERVQSMDIVRWVGLYQPAFRLSNALLSTVQNADPEKTIQIMVRSFAGEPAATLAADFAGYGANLLSQGVDTGGGTIFQLELPETEVASVARLPGVAWVETKPTPRLYNAVSRSSVAMNKDAVENTLGLYGEDQIVVVGDTGFSTGNESTMHQDFRGHFYKGSWGNGACGTWADANGHGTHVAGSVLGNGVMDGAVTTTHSYTGTHAGIAPEALLWGWGFCDDWSGLPGSDPYNDYFGVMYDDDPRARISTNSWGYNASSGTYNTYSRETDRFIWDHPDMVVLFAASNDGTDANSDGIVDQDSMGVPAGSKNILTVGASENYRLTGGYNPGGACSSWGGCWSSDYPADPINSDLLSDDPSGMVAFSSRGPVDDGRLKPDVVAPGSNIVSTRDDSTTGWGVYNDYYIYMGGTSMATPLTAGAAAIVREFYTDTYGINPTAALVKATFINGAYDMTPGQYRDEVPDGSKDDVIRRADINQGWGRVDLATSLVYEAPRQLWFHEHTSGISTNDEYVVPVQVGYSDNPFRVSLVWSDREGTEASHGALVNDLDLEVIAPDNTTYYGNDIISDGLLDGDVDHVNNVEGVDLAPGVGVYTIIVRGYNIPNGPQPFALVISGDIVEGSKGILNGTVTEDGSGNSIENALVVASNPTRTVSLSTNAMGFYSNTIPAEAYTLTASAYGYNPSTVSNINVISGSTTTQDFALTAGDSYLLSGTVTDANTGWGLFASVEIIPDGFPAETVWTDPWTGAYSVTVAGNYSHTLNVSVWDGIPGYVPQSREININSDTVEDFALDVDEVACEAPGYSYSYVYLQDFETDNGSYTSSGDWQWGTPTTWPSSCASGTQCWGTNLSGNYSNNANANLTSTVIDLTGEIAPLTATWWQASYMENASWDHAYAEVSINGGAWQVMWEHTGGTTQIDWEEKTYDISAAANGNVQFRFRITSDGSVNYDGYYIDRLSITGADACNAPADGGLLAGSVYDANTSEAVTGAEVRNTLGEMVVAQETPGANTISEAFYAIYAPAGSQTFTATMSMYQDSVVTGYPVQDGVTQGQDFFMPAGYPQVNPAALHAFLKPGMSATQQLVIDNGSTSIPFDFEIAEVAGGLNPADEDVLVVAVDSDAASAMETGLTNLGYSYLEVSQAVFQGMTVQELLAYPAIFHAGYHATGSEANLMGYLDGGGSLYISDNDEGYYRNSSTLYDSYLQATYVSDDPGIDNLIGEDIMTGLDLDISADPYPDDFTVGVDGTQIFQYTGGNAAGVAVARNGYKAIYTSFDFDDIVSVSNEEELIRRITDFFGMGDIAWLTETPITGTVASSGAQTIDVTFDASSLAPGIYTGTLRVASDTPYSPQDVPVELTVGTDYASVQTGNWTGSAWPGGTGTPTANDIVTVTAGTTVTVDSASAACYGLHVEPGGALIIPQGHNLTVEGYVDNHGKMMQTLTVLDNTYTELLHLRNQAGDETHHYGVEITPDGTGLGETTVSIWGHHESTTADEPGDTENRRIDIDPTAQHAAAVRFYYLQSELESGHNYTQVRAWHWDDPGWSLVGAGATTGSLDEYYYVEETGVTAYSPFVLKDSSTVAPTAVGLIGLAGQGSLLAAMLVLGLIAAGVVVRCLWHAGKAVSRK